MHLVYPPKFCIDIVSNFSCVVQSPQETSKTMAIQTFGGVYKVHYGLCENGVWPNPSGFYFLLQIRAYVIFKTLAGIAKFKY